jgi:hypothetical protein
MGKDDELLSADGVIPFMSGRSRMYRKVTPKSKPKRNTKQAQ